MNVTSHSLTREHTPAVIQVHEGDDVAVAIEAAEPGQVIEVGKRRLVAREAIDTGHKIALHDIAKGATVRKYGWPIGRAITDIPAGAHVHSHNLKTLLAGVEGYSYRKFDEPALPSSNAQFLGYRREDGSVGTRNEIWILPTVGCVARTAQRIAEIARDRHSGAVDGVYAFQHPFGCSQLGDDLAGTRAVLASLACNPNAGGVLIIGLGCESNQLDPLIERIPAQLRGKVRSLKAQAEEDEIEAGLRLVESLIAQVGGTRRVASPLSDLIVGLKCGGSDGFSGLTANPLVGHMADVVVGSGGSAVLTEIPEIFGAERTLMGRAEDEGVYEQLVAVVNDFKRYFLEHNEPISENPSPGNVAGGITTLEAKSLGAVQKAGRASVADVIRYSDRVRRGGLTLLEAPGNDAVSSTALAAAGATMILFTTGRGTPLGFPVPTVKIATNSELAQRKKNWIDFDAGATIQQGFDESAAELLSLITAIASGQTTAAERNGEREIAIWKRGVTL
jgi:altronate hydrolase